MIRLEFYKPLTALEIRDPAIEVCRLVAEPRGIHVTFDQPQQPAFSGFSGQRGRQRIGNGKHKNWYVNYQEEVPSASHPTILGRVAIKSPTDPSAMQFGGFDYGKYGEEKPTYTSVTVHTPSELGHYRPIDPAPDLLELTYDGLKDWVESNDLGIFIANEPVV